MSSGGPTTVEGWRKALDTAHTLRDEARGHLLDTERGVASLLKEFAAWRDRAPQILEAWRPIVARLSAEVGGDFAVIDTGGGCLALVGNYGPVRVTVTDWLDGDLSHPEAGTGWWVGFTLPDTPWTGRTESLIGDPDARGEAGLIKLLAHAIAGYWRGDRVPPVAPSQEHLAVINYERGDHA